MNTFASPAATVVRRYIVDIALSADQIHSFYAGQVRKVSAIDRHGVRIQFPLSALRNYVSHNGVRGSFQLAVDGQNRLCSFTKL